jgi:hypothetical protein
MEPTANLNQQLREKLERHHCKSGRLKGEFTVQWLLSLTAQREKDDKTILILEFERPLVKALDDYQTTYAPDAAMITIDIDLAANSFIYQHTTRAQKAGILRQEAAEAERERLHQQVQLKNRLAQDTAPFGVALAEKVADALLRGSFGFGHRDYCGTGLELHEGLYRYGELWDGWMITPFEWFADRSAFVAWLSQQSNASLSMINAKDPFFWGNQVITRERLEAFAYS